MRTSRLLALGLGLLTGAALLARRARRYDLRGKNALVTGGSRGLGLEIARVLAGRGAHVAITGRDAGSLERALGDLRARHPGGRFVAVPCDLRDGRAIDGMLAAVRAELGPVDVLVNNAGVIEVGPLDAMAIADFENAMKVHCFAPLRTALGVREDMRARGGGRIANIASVGGLAPVPHLLPYSASKFALVGLSEGLHVELARDGIAVSTIAPGLMRTGSPRNATFKGDHEAEYAWFTVADSLPLLSMASQRAARRIVRAIEHGEAHVVLGAPAQLAAAAHGIAPGLVVQAMTLTNRLLPRGTDRTARKGSESETAVTASPLTAATRAAAARNNEL